MIREDYKELVLVSDIPSNWSCQPIKRSIVDHFGGAWGEEQKNDNNDRVCIRIADFDYSNRTVKEDLIPTIRNYTPETIKRLILKKGDIIIEKSGGGDKTPVGRTIVFKQDYEALFANFSERIRIQNKHNPEYINYALMAFYSIGGSFNYFNQTTGIQNLSMGKYLSDIYLPNPPLDEQNKIVKYLDSICGNINSIIKQHRNTIKRLTDYKNNYINQSITQGIKSSPEMKNSLIDWLGDIPSNWQVKKIKYVFTIRKRIAGKDGLTVLSITQNGIVPKNIESNEGQIAESYENYQIVEPGDFAMNHMDLLTGWVDVSKYSGVTSPDYRVFTLDDQENNDYRYFKYMMQMFYFNKIFYGLGAGISTKGRWRLQAPIFKNFKIPVPPLEEQREIADSIEEKVTKIDSVVAKHTEIIEKLEEYKKSIIYHAVTGKIDCSGGAENE